MSQPQRPRRRGGQTPPLQVVTPEVQPQALIPMPAAQPPAVPPPVAPVPAPLAAPQPAGDHVIIQKRFDSRTGRPQIALCFQMQDPNNRREYLVDVPMGEAIAEQIFTVADDHRAHYAPEWFETKPVLTPVG